MENSHSEHDKNIHFDTIPDLLAMKEKWGVSESEIMNAIAQVGVSRPKVEEYLLNNKWTEKSDNEPSFQKRDLNEDETY
jgi:hypothetical protein